MFTKVFVGNSMLKFAFAPPQTDLDLRTGKDGKKKEQNNLPKPSGHNTDRFLRSVYYYWWAFLRLNESYIECCKNGGKGQHAALYRDFGDIRDDARPTIKEEADHFKTWWVERGAYLFCEPREFPLPQLIERPVEGMNYGANLMISVPYSNELEETVHQIRMLLQPKFEEHYRIEGYSSKALYRVEDKHNLSALEYSLQLIIAERKFKQVFKKTGHLSQLAIIASSRSPSKYDKEPLVVDFGGRLKNAAKAGLDRGHAWIDNVVLGRFPDANNHEDDRPASGIPTLERRRLHSGNLNRIARLGAIQVNEI